MHINFKLKLSFFKHDKTIYNLLAGLEINNYLLPSYGQTVIIELHQNNTLEESINILLLNETEKNNSYTLRIPACSATDVCRVRQFLNSITDLTLSAEQWIKECKINDAKIEQFLHKMNIDYFRSGTLIIITILAALVLILSILLIHINYY